MKRPRRNHAATFKAKVAIAVLRGDKTLAELAQQYDVHPNQIVQWKTQLQERATDLFATAAEQLGVSRKTYYKWEQRGLTTLIGSLEDQPCGRPTQPVDAQKQSLGKQLAQAHRENTILQHKIALIGSLGISPVPRAAAPPRVR